MVYKRKGGNFQYQQPNQYQQYQQQPNQFQQPQTNYNGMIGDTMKTMQPVYDASASIGIAYSIFSAVMATIICSIGIFIGFWVKNLNSDKSAKTSGIVKNAECSITKTKKSTSKSCIATIDYKVNNVDYSGTTTTSDIINKGQTIDIYYDPKNPNNFITNSYTNIIGWIIIVICIIILLSSWGWLIMTLLFKPVAAASGVGAVAGVIMPGNNSGTNFDFEY